MLIDKALLAFGTLKRPCRAAVSNIFSKCLLLGTAISQIWDIGTLPPCRCLSDLKHWNTRTLQVPSGRYAALHVKHVTTINATNKHIVPMVVLMYWFNIPTCIWNMSYVGIASSEGWQFSSLAKQAPFPSSPHQIIIRIQQHQLKRSRLPNRLMPPFWMCEYVHAVKHVRAVSSNTRLCSGPGSILILSDNLSSPLLPLLHQHQIKESFSTCSSKSAHSFFPFISLMKWLGWSEAKFSNLFSLPQDLVLPCTVWAPENANLKAPRVPLSVTWN